MPAETEHVDRRKQMRLSNVLRRLMKQKELTTKQLAFDVSIPEGTLKTWLAGSAPRSLSDVRKVAQFLNVSFEFLIFGDETFAAQRSTKGKSYEVLLKIQIEPVDENDTESVIHVLDIEPIKAKLD